MSFVVSSLLSFLFGCCPPSGLFCDFFVIGTLQLALLLIVEFSSICFSRLMFSNSEGSLALLFSTVLVNSTWFGCCLLAVCIFSVSSDTHFSRAVIFALSFVCSDLNAYTVLLSSRISDFNSAISIFSELSPITGVFCSAGSDLMIVRFLTIISDRTFGSSLSINDCNA